ncbi:MAG: hypothetical protein N3A38_17000, partial [Planctomycetota bacterium]|nr:hypothetical protein [Planctomycetota bacterium]
PVEFERNEERTPGAEISEPFETPFKAVLTPEGRVHSLCRLDPDPRRNAELWGCLPEMYWFHRATRLKPAVGAEVLLAHGSETGRGGSAPLPIAVVSPCGKGRVLYFAVRDMWRMRFPSELGPEKLERFYGHAVQYLGLPHLLGESRRVWIAADSREYSSGDTIRLNARILDTSYMPSGRDRYAVEIASADGGTAWRGEILASPPGSGNFRGEIPARAEGDFKLRIVDEEEGETEIRIAAPRIELDDPGMKIELLKEIARRSGGEYFPPERAGELPDAIRKSRKKVEFRIEDPLWDAPIMALAFSLLMGIEWFLRKRSDLC